MSLLSRVREFFVRAATTVRLISPWRAQVPVGATRDLGRYYRWYRDNVVFRACVDEIATSFAEAPLVVRERAMDGSLTDPGADHQLAVLLESPHPEEQLSGYELRQRVMVDLRVSGNAFIRIIRNRFGVPVRLWPLRVDLVQIKATPDGQIDFYRYGQPATNWSGGAESPIASWEDYPSADVIHLKNPDPTDDFWGLPPSGASELQIDELMTAYVANFWKNDGTPSVVITLEEKKVPKDRREFIEQQYTERYGPTGSRVAATGSDVKITKLGQDFSALKLGDFFGQTEARICASQQVPPAVVGVKVGLTTINWASYKSARRSFWEETMAPIFQWIGKKLTSALAREFGANLVIISDTTAVEALAESQDDRRTFALDAWNAGAITLNRFEQYCGMPLTPEGDFRKPSPSPIAKRAVPEPALPPAPGANDPILGEPGDQPESEAVAA